MANWISTLIAALAALFGIPLLLGIVEGWNGPENEEKPDNGSTPIVWPCPVPGND